MPEPKQPDGRVYRTLKSNGRFSDLPVEEIRRRIAHLLPEFRCYPECPGWAIFDSDWRGFEIELCDECNSYREESCKLGDHDVAKLPEAKAEFVVFLRKRQNPGFTAKQVKAIAKEISHG